MINKERLKQLGLDYVDEYYFDDIHHSLVFKKDNLCVIVDDNLCFYDKNKIFDYSKYCEMQNHYIDNYQKFYRFNAIDDTIYDDIKDWLNKSPDDIELVDQGGNFDNIHVDNTPLEKEFYDLFIDTYGEDASQYLKKEYAISLNKGRNAFVDYVIETTKGNYAVELNGVSYHHPCIIGNENYQKQLEKQNTLNLYNFKLYRFSHENLTFKEQTIDNIKLYFGDKGNFIDSLLIKENRKFKLYDHQEEVLLDINKSRLEGINTSLIVLPTASGKSRIAIEDMVSLANKKLIHRILVMVPSLKVKQDWIKRLSFLANKLDVEISLYNNVFLKKNSLPKDYYDYILFDEAQHAQAANCKKTLQYFNPKYLVGLTATPDRLDQKKLEEIFGQYETKLTLQEAIQKGVIANIRCYRLESNIDLSKVRYNGKDYNYADLEKNLIVDSRNELIVETILKYFAPRENFYKQGIVFCVNVAHCKKLEKMFLEKGIIARAVYGSNKENDHIFEEYQNKKVQFLLSCQVISEGWDSPQTEVIVMARPTLSKVLYMQQLGRGLRNYPGKECLYLIDVVDNYESKLTPWCFNSLFKIPHYSDFAGVVNNNFDYLNIFGLSEKEIAMKEIDIFTFEEKYPSYQSLEQAARTLFIGTETLSKWVKVHPQYSSLYLPIGNKMAPYFSENDLLKIKTEKKLKDHNEETILEDFLAFIDENTLTYSFKLIFLISMLELVDKEGEVNLDDLINRYSSFYLKRIENNLPVDRKGCIYDQDYLLDKSKIKKNILDNPFEKFERKRFIYFSKDLNILSFNPVLWRKLDNNLKSSIIKKEKEFLKEYYQNLGGLIDGI